MAGDRGRPDQAPGLRRLAPGDPALGEVLALIRASFAYMEDRIDPPSSMHRLDAEELDRQAGSAEIWALGDPVRACVFLTPKPDCLYVGKLAVADVERRQGLARQLLELAESRAAALGKDWLELQTRIELVENQHAFQAMGFEKTAETTHPGYQRPTSVTFRRRVSS